MHDLGILKNYLKSIGRDVLQTTGVDSTSEWIGWDSLKKILICEETWSNRLFLEDSEMFVS